MLNSWEFVYTQEMCLCLVEAEHLAQKKSDLSTRQGGTCYDRMGGGGGGTAVYEAEDKGKKRKNIILKGYNSFNIWK